MRKTEFQRIPASLQKRPFRHPSDIGRACEQMKQRRPARFRAPCPGRIGTRRRRPDGGKTGLDRSGQPSLSQRKGRFLDGFDEKPASARAPPGKVGEKGGSRPGDIPDQGRAGIRVLGDKGVFPSKPAGKPAPSAADGLERPMTSMDVRPSGRTRDEAPYEPSRTAQTQRAGKGQRQEGRGPITSGPCNMAQVRRLRAGLRPPGTTRGSFRKRRRRSPTASEGKALPARAQVAHPSFARKTKRPQGAQYTIPMAARTSSSVAFAISLARRLPSRSTSSM